MEQQKRMFSQPIGARTPPPRIYPQRNNHSNFLAGLAVGLSGAALILSCIALFFALRSGAEKEGSAAELEESPKTSIGARDTIEYRDQVIPVLEGVPVNAYQDGRFQRNEQGWLTYEVDGKAAAVGIDVSTYQKEIDWQQVADAGVQFAILRVGYRGYSKGMIMPDETFEMNIQGALAAGLEVGVYFFSQAVNVWEAQEEADYVLKAIQGYDVTYPIAFDWEYIDGNSKARTYGLETDQRTLCAGAFCDRIAQAGYTPVIYFNQDLGYLGYHLDQLTDYSFWLAEYNPEPTFYYDFDLWQYSHRGTVPGIEGDVDLNLDFRPLKETG